MEHWKNLSLESIAEEIDGIIYIEKWKDIIGFEGLYQISNFGRAKSLSKRFEYYTKTERILRPRKLNTGYYSFTLYLKLVPCYRTIHRLVAAHFINNPEAKPEVNHNDFDRSNNRDTNLEWATRKENVEHMIKHNRFKFNLKPIIKLSNEDVVEIRKRLQNNYYGLGTMLAKEYNVSMDTISDIKTGRKRKGKECFPSPLD